MIIDNVKYIEFPAFETNQFKKGDLVKIYDSQVNQGMAFHRVVAIRDEYVVFNIDSITGDSNGCKYWSVNFRSCRKLEAISPREIYISKKALNLLFKNPEYYFQEAVIYSKVMDDSHRDFMKFVEVIE